LQSVDSNNKEILKHAYICAILKAVALFSLPFLAISVYFNLIADFRLIPLTIQVVVFSAFILFYFYRNSMRSSVLAWSLTFLVFIAANINCLVNESISHSGVAAMVGSFTLAVISHRLSQFAFIFLMQISLLTSYSFAVDFQYESTEVRWLMVILTGQLIVLNGMSFLFKRVETLFKKEHELRLSSEAAAREKSRFLANMSHEIRTPIAGVVGMLDNLSNDTLSPAQQEKLRLAQNSSEILSRIVDDILDYSKIEAGKLVLASDSFPLNEVFEQVLFITRQSLPTNANTLVFSKNWDDNIVVMGDKTRLQQVLLNLLSNANKFTQNGKITLTADLLHNEEDYLLKCTVKDTGIGMDEVQVSQLFQPFHQVDNSSAKKVQGTGLGLVICRQILKLMGGAIRVESKPARGSTFFFEVPLARSTQDEVPATVEDDTKLDPTEITVLVVEDNEINQAILMDMLENLQIKAILAEDGLQALEQLKNMAALDIDVILMDCQMPVLDGYDTTKRIRSGMAGEQWQSVPIIALTANALDGDREKCLQAGMSDYLSKPVKKNNLLEAINKVVIK